MLVWATGIRSLGDRIAFAGRVKCGTFKGMPLGHDMYGGVQSDLHMTIPTLHQQPLQQCSMDKQSSPF